ncbi:MAG TPA: beta-propeller fold lactonase family protein [Solirubrobacteraceae bacterium]|nr:beta-propeller fold lactonase family protein [Solirubrobacteraceae bacterium]
MRFGSFSVRTIAIAAGALALLTPPSAFAADGFGPLSGAHGCLVAPDEGTPTYDTSDCGTGKGLYGASAVAVSPDGKNVYVAGGVAGLDVAKSYGAVAILARDPASGSITEVSCLSSDGTDHRDGASGACAPEPSLLGASGVAVSPDGKTVYVSSSSSASVVAFSRDPATGGLTRLGCFQGTPRPGAPCGAANLFSSASSPLVSADGSALYVAAPESGAVSAIDASDRLRTPAGIVPALPAAPSSTSDGSTATNAASGDSTPATGAASPSATSTAPSAGASSSVSAIFTASVVGDELLNPCIAVNGLDGTCGVGVATEGLGELVLSPDGRQVYGTATESKAIDVFAPAAGGGLTETSCVMQNAPAGLCRSDRGLSKPTDLAVSPDGKNVYVANTSGSLSDDILVMTRDTTTGAVIGTACVEYAPKEEESGEPEEDEEGEENEEDAKGKPAPKGKDKGKRARASAAGNCTASPGLGNVEVVAVSGDGSSVYSIGAGSAAVFTRNPSSGALSEASCAENEDPRCTDMPSLQGISDAAVSPDGHQVYVVSQRSNALMVFGVGAAVTTGHAAASRAGLAHVSVACPTGLRRACSGRVQLTRAIVHASRRGHNGRHGARHAYVHRVTAGRSASFSIAPGAHASVGVKLSARMRNLLARRHRLRLMAVVRANPSAGGSGYGRHVTLALTHR